MIRILIVDEQSVHGTALGLLLDAQKDQEVIGVEQDVSSACKMAEAVADGPDIIVYEESRSDQTSSRNIRQLTRISGSTPILVIGERDIETAALRAVIAGAKGYVPTNAAAQAVTDTIRTVAAGAVVLPACAHAALVEHFTPRFDADRHRALANLTPRQLEVLALLDKGLTNQQISSEIDVAIDTVKKHVSSVIDKLDVDSRLAAALYYHDAIRAEATAAANDDAAGGHIPAPHRAPAPARPYPVTRRRQTKRRS